MHKKKIKKIKKSKKDPFYKVGVKRNKIMWNLHNYGMSNEYVIHHPFVKRARKKTKQYRSIVLILCFGFVMMMTVVVSYIDFLRLISSFETFGFSVYLIIFWIFYYWCIQLIYPWKRCLRKYWSCPNCEEILPTKTIGRGRTVVYLSNKDNTATCPYCGKSLPTELQ